MDFAAAADLKTLLFVTTRATKKYTNLLAHADIEVLAQFRVVDATIILDTH